VQGIGEDAVTLVNAGTTIVQNLGTSAAQEQSQVIAANNASARTDQGPVFEAYKNKNLNNSTDELLQCATRQVAGSYGAAFNLAQGFPRDFATARTKKWQGYYNSEGEARTLARTKIGKDPIQVEANKWRSRDGKWQYRAKPIDTADNHVHIEELNPQTGEVLQNWHLRWPSETTK
jgi:hypothetical protein